MVGTRTYSSFVNLFTFATLLALLSFASGARAGVFRTADPAQAAAFLAGMDVEGFDGLPARTLTSYSNGQTISSGDTFNTRDGATQPTFNCGGGTLNDPLGNPGTPIAILDPSGAIASDFVSPNNVAGPVRPNDATALFGDGFLEVFFVENVARIGFWVTHGAAEVLLFDQQGAAFGSGTTSAIASEGEFVGIDRGRAEIKLISIFGVEGSSFTLDDFAWSEASLLEGGDRTLAFVGHVANGVDGVTDLDGATNGVVSPDGRQLYVASERDDALVVFDRNPHTGELAWVESHRDGQSGVDGVDFPQAVAISPDGANVYVMATDSVAAFSRDPADGRLTFMEVHRQGVAGVTGLRNPFDLAVSDDGRHVYVAGHASQAVAVFARDAGNGSLAFLEAVTDGLLDAGNLPHHMCLSRDGRSLYMATFHSQLVAFSRDAQTGHLALAEVEEVGELLGATAHCVVSGDGRFVYSGSQGGGVRVFARDGLSSQLASVGAVQGPTSFGSAMQLSADDRDLYVHDWSGGFDVLNRDDDTGILETLEHVEDGAEGVTGIAGGGAQPLVPSPDGRHLYVMGNGADGIGIFSRSVLHRTGSVADQVDGNGAELGRPRAVAISPDSRFVYVAGELLDGIAAYEIDSATDQLVFLDRLANGDFDPTSGLFVFGLDDPSDLVVSPDGDQLYASAEAGNAVVWFDRAPDGTLVYRGSYFDPRLDGARSITIAPDGDHVYATGALANSWIGFARASNGSLSALPPFPSGGDEDLNDPEGIAVSADGDYAFVLGHVPITWGQLAAYRRETNGQLTAVDFFTDLDLGTSQLELSEDGRHLYVSHRETGARDLSVVGWDAASETLGLIERHRHVPGGSPDSIDGATGISLSPDGRYLAVGGFDSDAIALFARDAASGRLALAQQIFEADAPGDGFGGPEDLRFTPDGQYLLVTGRGSNDGSLTLVAVPEAGFALALLSGAALLALSPGRAGRADVGACSSGSCRGTCARRSRPPGADTVASRPA